MGTLSFLLASSDLSGGAVALIFLAFGFGAAGGIGLMLLRARHEAARQKDQIDRTLSDARTRAEEVVRAAEVEAQKKHLEAVSRFDKETAETRNELKEVEKRLAKRDESLDKKMDVLVTKERKIESAEAQLAEREKQVTRKSEAVEQLYADQRAELLRISSLTPDEARALCLRRIESEVEREAGQFIEKTLTEAESTAKEKARHIVIGAIQRYAAEHTCESVVAAIDVPSDEMKGRIIGREGRNIRAFEKATGVTVVVDDTPGVVSVSCFDPVRREIARMSLERLIRDGRIHPTRIEELVNESTAEVEQQILEAGKRAAMEANVGQLHKKIIEQLGRLQYRTSYGQNVLRHSIEVAYLTGMMADELGLDAMLARRCGLLHDIGKAAPHEQEGTHTQLGAELCKRCNEHPAVVNAAAGHHGDVAATHPYTPLVTAADAISASRPGSRRESLEAYIKRLQELEGIATSFAGVRQAFAVEAGREVRVIVDAVRVDDRSSLKLARDIADKIQEQMTYPGEIKITVLREIRAVEYAR